MTRRRAICLALVCCAGFAGCRPGPATERKPNIVLVLVDTLRKDGLHLYGNERRTSDAVDALAAEGWVFEHHIASASQTVPSMVSLMLSRHPADHGREKDEPIGRHAPTLRDCAAMLHEVASA